jgi:signal transduction histidine kinase
LGSLKESTTSPDHRKTAGEIEAFVEQAIQDMRSLLFELSPPILYEIGLEEAIEWYAEKIHKQYGIIVHFVSDGSPKPLEAGFRVLIFHAARELLFNVAKHSRASQAKVTIRKDAERLRIDVMDDGIGFDPSGVDTRDKHVSGFGLFTLRECLESLGGSLDVQSKIGMGTRITLLAPLKAGAESDDPEKTCPI